MRWSPEKTANPDAQWLITRGLCQAPAWPDPAEHLSKQVSLRQCVDATDGKRGQGYYSSLQMNWEIAVSLPSLAFNPYMNKRGRSTFSYPETRGQPLSQSWRQNWPGLMDRTLGVMERGRLGLSWVSGSGPQKRGAGNSLRWQLWGGMPTGHPHSSLQDAGKTGADTGLGLRDVM